MRGPRLISDAERLGHLAEVAVCGAALLGDGPLPHHCVAALRRRLAAGALREVEESVAPIGDPTLARDLLGAFALLVGALPDDPTHAEMAWVEFCCWRLRGVRPRELGVAMGRVLSALFDPVRPS